MIYNSVFLLQASTSSFWASTLRISSRFLGTFGTISGFVRVSVVGSRSQEVYLEENKSIWRVFSLVLFSMVCHPSLGVFTDSLRATSTDVNPYFSHFSFPIDTTSYLQELAGVVISVLQLQTQDLWETTCAPELCGSSLNNLIRQVISNYLRFVVLIICGHLKCPMRA